MSEIDRKPIFQAVKQLRSGRAYTIDEVRLLDRAIDQAMGWITVTAPIPPTGRRVVGPRGIALMHEFEKCRLTAYPDPGSADGLPWTIGWGSTGPGIHRGVTWTQAQADARFTHDVNEVYGAAVDRLLGDSPTTQSQFDAMVSLTYNIGIGSTNRSRPGGFTRSTVLRKHKAGDFAGAARAFLLWNKNDGVVMRGLTRRRLAEADLYDDDGVPA